MISPESTVNLRCPTAKIPILSKWIIINGQNNEQNLRSYNVTIV